MKNIIISIYIVSKLLKNGLIYFYKDALFLFSVIVKYVCFLIVIVWLHRVATLVSMFFLIYTLKKFL